jgi:HEAT repeat protein
MIRAPWPAALAFGVIAALAAARAGDDVATQLHSSKVADRLLAIDSIRRNGAKEAEALLKAALKDSDWEVVEKAAEALGERGTPASVDALVKLALDGPVRRVRLAAARATGRLDPAAAAAQFGKAQQGATPLRANEALAATAERCGEASRAALTAALGSSDALQRAAAAGGLHAFAAGERAPLLARCLDDAALPVGAAALESARLHPDAALLPALLGALGKRDLAAVLERRIDSAVVALLQATPAEGRADVAAKLLEALKTAAAGSARERAVRLVGRCAAKPPPKAGAAADAPGEPPLIGADAAVAALAPMAAVSEEGTRAAAVRALSQVASDAALDALLPVAADDRSARVRDVALRDLIAARGIGHVKTFEVASKLLGDSDVDVREDAIVALGSPDAKGAAALLLPKLGDATWEVAVAAAVSLGKTQDPAALAPLEQLLQDKDWKKACAALVGLGHLHQKAAVPHLIDALHGKTPTARLTGLEFLRRLTLEKVGNKETAWKEWWSKHSASYQFPDPVAAAKQAQKYGYAANPNGYGTLYQDLDVLCFESRGDHIEKLLDALKIVHRDTRSGAVEEAGVAPFGVYVANCTGEAQPPDLDVVRWFVHTGGYLFCSCWALTYHAAQVRPGFAQQFKTSAEVVDLVPAHPCRESPYLTGVFDDVSRPRYTLWGAHLIDVLDPERVEVLIDSPECAAKWGCGNLAAWWSIGHGVILDSVNHFDLQGFEHAPKMKDAAERMAYALDSMGLSYADVRAIPIEIWKSPTKTAEEVRDLSAFRFITNFVRRKRIAGA